jgi:hypothetical protein
MPLQSDGDFVVDSPASRDWRLGIAGGAVMTAVSILLAIWGGGPGLIIGLAGTVFFGLICLPLSLVRAARPRHDLVVTADGFTVDRGIADIGFVSWNEVQSIGTTSLGPVSFVLVRLRDPAAFVRRHGLVSRIPLRLLGQSRLRIVQISSQDLPMPVSEMARMMEARRTARSG